MTAYGYFPGCSLRGTGVAYEESLLALFKLLGLELEELKDWNCCGATSYMSIEEDSAFLLSARNLALARKSHCRDLVAPCSACYLVLRKTQDYAGRYPAIGRNVKNALAAAKLPPLDGVRVRHPLEVLYTDVGVAALKSKLVRSWRGGRVACYYGCQIVRPYGEVDRDHNPTRMDELMHAAGVPTIDYALKTKCCGGALTGTIHEVGVRMNFVLLKEAMRKGAQAIVTVCPLCQYNLDAYQAEIRRSTGEHLDLPVLYFTQVLGWLLGADAESLGIRRSISGRKFIRQWFTTETAEAKAYV
jgi:heterodisulfide reductase subunit B